MLAPPQRKRPRSPSPPIEIDHSSPLDILLKRRKRTQYHNFISAPSSSYADINPFDVSTHQPYIDSSMEAEPSSVPYNRFVEKRRTRQWERLNAPQTQPSSSHHSADSNATYLTNPSAAYPTHSQPEPQREPHSPLPILRSYSQPTPYHLNTHVMSSSPIRHDSPSSSPFRAEQGGKYPSIDEISSFELSSSTRTKVEEDLRGDFDLMDEDEMRREWGEEYTTQNSLLHSLHRTRIQQHQYTPDHLSIHTPPLYTPSPHHNQNSYCQGDSVQPGPTPYRTTTWLSSSPFVTPYHQTTRANNGTSPRVEGEAEEGMVTEVEMEDEVKKRYEEANRLLRELEVVRRQRWGGE